MKYTREQLIKAQQKYNINFLSSPQDFVETISDDLECAESQIDYLLSLLDD